MCKVPRMSSAKGDNSSLDKPDIQYNFENSWIWKRKLRLQHTGWLQYIPPLLLGNLSMLVSQGLAYFTTTTTVTSWLMTIAKLLWTVGVVDILTIKFNVIRPPDEPLPKRLNDDTKEDTSCDMISIMHLRHSCRSFQPRKLSNKDSRGDLTHCNYRIKTNHRNFIDPIRVCSQSIECLAYCELSRVSSCHWTSNV